MNFDAPNLDLIGRLGLALALGLCVGIERGWREREDAGGARTAGIRTYALLGLTGGVLAALVPVFGPIAPGIIIAALGSVFAVFSYRENVAGNSFSVTSTVAAFLVLVLGAYAVAGEVWIAAMAGIAMVALLAARESLHGWLKRLAWQELRSGILLLAMTFVALPLLPNRTIDPWNAVNPYELWFLTILIAVISATGYAAIRIAGPRRGLLFGSLAGALVSSTAVTFSLAQRGKQQHGVMFAGGAAIASSVSMARAAAIVAALAPAESGPFLSAFLPASAITAIAGLLAWRGSSNAENGAAGGSQFELGNPFDLGAVLRFGALLSVVLVLSKFAQARFGDAGFLGLAALAGAVDVDPITLTAARMAGAGEAHIALAGVIIAILLNIGSKLTIGFISGSPRFGFAHLALLTPAILILGGWLVWAFPA